MAEHIEGWWWKRNWWQQPKKNFVIKFFNLSPLHVVIYGWKHVCRCVFIPSWSIWCMRRKLYNCGVKIKGSTSALFWGEDFNINFYRLNFFIITFHHHKPSYSTTTTTSSSSLWIINYKIIKKIFSIFTQHVKFAHLQHGLLSGTKIILIIYSPFLSQIIKS